MAIYTGDLVHHLAQFEHPEWSPAFDLLPELSAESRRRVLERALRERALLLTAHLPTPGTARPDEAGGWQTSA
jgi:glyoxylase-like metal-dependent hydrolase (beta-lactamase superfamily II)